MEVDVVTNFDIAAAHIHVEQFIRRVREQGILKSVWPINRMDILPSTWQTLAHIVNLINPPIEPKEQISNISRLQRHFLTYKYIHMNTNSI